ncbi:hypothetical protein HDV00_005835, partial [Rhizophlyctis rosea]
MVEEDSELVDDYFCWVAWSRGLHAVPRRGWVEGLQQFVQVFHDLDLISRCDTVPSGLVEALTSAALVGCQDGVMLMANVLDKYRDKYYGEGNADEGDLAKSFAKWYNNAEVSDIILRYYHVLTSGEATSKHFDRDMLHFLQGDAGFMVEKILKSWKEVNSASDDGEGVSRNCIALAMLAAKQGWEKVANAVVDAWGRQSGRRYGWVCRGAYGGFGEILYQGWDFPDDNAKCPLVEAARSVEKAAADP